MHEKLILEVYHMAGFPIHLNKNSWKEKYHILSIPLPSIISIYHHEYWMSFSKYRDWQTALLLVR